MRSKRRNTNIKILQSQLQNFTLREETKPIQKPVNEETPKAIVVEELPVVDKLKKRKGIPKDELINTRRLLTQ